MSTDWLGPRMYRPSLEEMLRGALAPWTPEVHYITNFRYPTQGRLRFLSARASRTSPNQARARSGRRSTRGNRTLRFANGYDDGIRRARVVDCPARPRFR